MEGSSADLIVFWVVVVARLLLPLGIFRYPLVAILACLILDAVDQTIFQVFTNLNLDGYQGYDKALDIYYLSIAYIATMRNWSSLFAFKASRFLFYYRLVGVLAFNVTHVRLLLFIFPNTFEYFFIFYELVRMRWNPLRLSKRAVIIAVAAIWIFIKLPQEWWIHIAQLDVTDSIKTHVFGVAATAPWTEAIGARPWVLLVAAAGLGLLGLFVWWLVTKKLPAADWKLKLAADPLPPQMTEKEQRVAATARQRLFSSTLLEKIVLVGFVTVIFAQIVPGIRSTNLQLVIGVGILIIANTFISHWLARRERGWSSTVREFLAMSVVNLGTVFLFSFLLPRAEGALNLGDTLFFVMLLTLLVTLYDRYRFVFDERFRGTSEDGRVQQTQ